MNVVRTSEPFHFMRAVRFDEIDAAGIVFFAHLVRYAHEAMERFFDPLDGGYVRLISERRLGLPAVQLHSAFTAPVRYGDTLDIETSVARLGNRSVTLSYRMLRAADGVLCASMQHTVVMVELDTMQSCDMPADVRELLAQYLIDAR